jgi:hypothetical protein
MQSIQRALAARQTRKRIRSAPENHQDQNREAAAVILADQERYGGQKGGLVRWATLVLSRKVELEPPEAKKNQGELF